MILRKLPLHKKQTPGLLEPRCAALKSLRFLMVFPCYDTSRAITSLILCYALIIPTEIFLSMGFLYYLKRYIVVFIEIMQIMH